MTNTPEKYELIKLPCDEWMALGESLVLSEREWRVLTRFAAYRLLHSTRDQHRYDSYGLLVVAGPPGTGKSAGVRAAADHALRALGKSGNGLVINVAGLLDEHLGNTPKLAAHLIAEIELSASRLATVVIWEDAEAVFISRAQAFSSDDPTDVPRAVTVLLNGFDRLRHLPNVVMYATTNFDGAMDYALISRSDMVVRFNLPDSAQRRAILRPRLQRLKKETALQQMVDATEGWSGRDLVRINLLAFLESDVASPEELTEEDYLKAVRNGKSTTDRKEEMWSGLSSVSQEASTPRRSKWPWPKR